MKIEECPLCGCMEIGEGMQTAQGKVYPVDNFPMSFGSDIVHYICTDCGYIIASRVKKPEKFRY